MGSEPPGGAVSNYSGGRLFLRAGHNPAASFMTWLVVVALSCSTVSSLSVVKNNRLHSSEVESSFHESIRSFVFGRGRGQVHGFQHLR